MNAKSIAYWVTTGLFSVALAAGGLADLTGGLDEAMHHLGYPASVARILGVWKLLGVAALLAPGLPRLKEWAYAGFFFNLTGAFAAHQFAGDALADSVAPLVLLAVAAASYLLRPESRRFPWPQLGGPAAGGSRPVASH